MAETKTMTLRLSKEQASELEAVARVDGIPVAEAVRSAVAEHIREKRSDKDFQARLERLMSENAEILKRLAA